MSTGTSGGVPRIRAEHDPHGGCVGDTALLEGGGVGRRTAVTRVVSHPGSAKLG
jgi:hypothetical protein